jgi:hypothetical protein
MFRMSLPPWMLPMTMHPKAVAVSLLLVMLVRRALI